MRKAIFVILAAVLLIANGQKADALVNERVDNYYSDATFVNACGYTDTTCGSIWDFESGGCYTNYRYHEVYSCSTGEPVALDGTVHIEASINTDSSGVNHFALVAAGNLMGSGQTTGTVYTASDSDNYNPDVDDPSADLTVELKSDLKPQGSTSTLMLVQMLHIVVDATGNISAQVVSNSTSCGS